MNPNIAAVRDRRPGAQGTRRAACRPARQRKGGWFRRVGWRHLVGLLALAFSIFPILFVLSAALNPLGTLSSSELIPSQVTFENFRKVLFDTSFPLWFVNTLIIGLLSAGLSMFISACAAYAFSRFRFTGRRSGLLGMLLVQMFPAVPGDRRDLPDLRGDQRLWPAIGIQHRGGVCSCSTSAAPSA